MNVIHEDFMEEDIMADFDSDLVGENQVLVEALQMNYPNKNTETMEIKNEQQLKEVD